MDWTDTNYVLAFQLAVAGESEKGIAEGLGVTVNQLRQWRKEKPELSDSINKGRFHHKSKGSLVPHDNNGLRPRHRRFVEEFVIDFHVTNAAIRAGYSAKTAYSQGHDLLKKLEIQAALREQLSLYRQAHALTKDRLIQELALIAFSNPLELFDENGTLKDITALSENVARSIQSIKVRLISQKDGSDEVVTEIKFWDKVKTLELLGKHLGIFPVGLKYEQNQQYHQHQHVHLQDAGQNAGGTPGNSLVRNPNSPYANVPDDKIIEALMVMDALREESEREREERELEAEKEVRLAREQSNGSTGSGNGRK